MFENFCSDIIETMKCFALESFDLSCQAEHTKINSRLNSNPGLALITFWTTRPSTMMVTLYLTKLIDIRKNTDEHRILYKRTWDFI